jgi:hypothetical protein
MCATDGAPAGPGLPPYCRAPPLSRVPAVLPDRWSRLSGVALRPAPDHWVLRRQDWAPTLERRELARVTPARGGDERGRNARRPVWLPPEVPRCVVRRAADPKVGWSWMRRNQRSAINSAWRSSASSTSCCRPWPSCVSARTCVSDRIAVEAGAGTGRVEGRARRFTGPTWEPPAPADCCSARAARSIPRRRCAGRPAAAWESRTMLAHRGQQLAAPHRRAGPTVVRHQRLQRRRRRTTSARGHYVVSCCCPLSRTPTSTAIATASATTATAASDSSSSPFSSGTPGG